MDSSRGMLRGILFVLVMAGAGTAYGQPAPQTTRWMSAGSFQNWYASAGCEIEEGGQPPLQQYGAQWPAWYPYEDMQAAKGLWIGTTNYQQGPTLYPFKVVHVGPRVTGSGEFFPQQLELLSRYSATAVTVDGVAQGRDSAAIDAVDPALPCDRMIRNVVGTAIGVTMTRRILGFSQQFHDNYVVSDYSFRNDSARTLTGVRFFFQYRMAICFDASQEIGNPTSWGINTMIDTRGDSVKNDTDDFEQAGNPASPHMRIQYFWHGKFPAFTLFDNIGGPMWRPALPLSDPGDTVGRLAAAQFPGILTLHADTSPGNPDDDPREPSTTTYFGSDEKNNPPTSNNSMFNAAYMSAEYAVMSSGHAKPRHADRVQPDGMFDVPTGDPSQATTGGFSAANGYGPYTLAPGDSIRIVVAEGASGLSRDRCLSVGRRFKNGEISAKAKNDSVLTGKDSLFQTLRRALANYRGGWAAPQPPLPPKTFTVTSGSRGILLAWDVFAGAGPAITGFRIYRSVAQSWAPDSLVSASGPDARTWTDTLVRGGTRYFYYIQAVGRPEDNTGAAMTPAGVALTSNRASTQTYTGATLSPNGINAGPGGVPTRTALLQNYPNPFNPVTTIVYTLANQSAVRLEVYSILGQQVAMLVDGTRLAGSHQVRFDGSGLASGVYICRLTAGSSVMTMKLLLAR